jgi:hypothetical protein
MENRGALLTSTGRRKIIKGEDKERGGVADVCSSQY